MHDGIYIRILKWKYKETTGEKKSVEFNKWFRDM